MKRWKKMLFLVVAPSALLVNGVIWAYTNSVTLDLNIQPAGTFPDGSHGLAQVEPMAGNFTIVKGRAFKVEGVELYKIRLGSAGFSDQLRIHLMLMNPADIGKVLHNPNAFMLVSVWYPDPHGLWTLSDRTTTVTMDTYSSAVMSQVSGDVILQPKVSGQTTLYVLATIVVPGGHPHGVESALNELKFYCDVR